MFTTHLFLHLSEDNGQIVVDCNGLTFQASTGEDPNVKSLLFTSTMPGMAINVRETPEEIGEMMDRANKAKMAMLATSIAAAAESILNAAGLTEEVIERFRKFPSEELRQNEDEGEEEVSGREIFEFLKQQQGQ